MSNTTVLGETAPSFLQPFVVKQAIVGLEMSTSDKPLLEYLRFLQTKLPFRACRFLHVVPRFDLYQYMDVDAERPIAGQYAMSEAFVNEMAASIIKHLSPPSNEVIDYQVQEGNPLESLLEEAQDTKADLVIIGQKASATSHGILARNIVRKSTTNALVVPEKTFPRLDAILVPVDFSSHSAKALQTAVAINAQLQKPVKIIAVNVYQLPDMRAFTINKTEGQFRKMVKADRTEAFNTFINSHVGEGREHVFTYLLEQDSPGTANYLMDFAMENNFDLIVMGAKGHSRVERLLLGSVTERLMTINDSIATLIVR